MRLVFLAYNCFICSLKTRDFFPVGDCLCTKGYSIFLRKKPFEICLTSSSFEILFSVKLAQDQLGIFGSPLHWFIYFLTWGLGRMECFFLEFGWYV